MLILDQVSSMIVNIELIESSFMSEDVLRTNPDLPPVLVNLRLHSPDWSVTIEDAELLRLYIDLRSSFADATIRGVGAFINSRYETVLEVRPHINGCVLSSIYEPSEKFINLSEIRSIFKFIEGFIRSILFEKRAYLLNAFNISQSFDIFHILQAIDGASEIKSD